MKAFIATTMTILLVAQAGFAKISCTTEDERLVVDPQRKRVTLTKLKDGKPHRLKILNPANHGFQMFGNNSQAFELEGGYVVGIKDTKNPKRKDISVFASGEIRSSFNDCKEN